MSENASHPSKNEPGGQLAANIARFARVLRRAGIPAGPGAVIDAVAAVEAAGIGRREDVYWALHAVFVTRHDQSPVFHQAFDLYWRSRDLVERLLQILSPVAPPRTPQEPPKSGARRVSDAMRDQAPASAPKAMEEVEIDARLTMSEREILKAKDFQQMTAEELALARKALRRLALPQDRVPVRRTKSASTGRIDPRRTMRQSMRAGGQMIRLAMKEPRLEHPPVVALLDISGSMATYSRLFLHFLHALGETRRVSAFTFGTRLTNITRALRHRDPDDALAECGTMARDWSGGTRIGASLERFNRDWSRRVLSGNPLVLLVTDGLERDEGDLLAKEADRLQRSCRRLVWLNPLLGYEGFEAKARGIKALLPHVDEFRSSHSLGAIEDLCAALAARPTRARMIRPAAREHAA